jgi:hypothetical protein
VWERGAPLRDPRAADGGARAHRLPLNAVVTARREPAATLLDAAAEAASADALGSRIGSSGVLVAETDRGFLRVAVGPARTALAAHATALAELRRAWPAAPVADRAPWTLAAGETGLAAWALERRLEGATPPPAIGPRLAAECLDFLVALHDVRGDAPATASCAADAEVVAAECAPAQAARIRTLGEDLDQRLVGLPRGFAHGDFWSGNLLVSGDSLTGVVDWAAAGSSRLPLLDLLHLHVSARRELTGASLGAALLDYAGDATGAERATAAAYERRTGVDADRGDLIAAYWLSATARELTDPDRSRDRRAAARFVRDNVDRVAERLAVPVRRSR